LVIDKADYLYVYVSNASTDYPVYFDNLQVTHYRGVLFEETHYYLFGLPMAGISSKAAGITENKLKHEGKESSEMSSLMVQDLSDWIMEQECMITKLADGIILTHLLIK
jgi:hypothetical protein